MMALSDEDHRILCLDSGSDEIAMAGIRTYGYSESLDWPSLVNGRSLTSNS